MTNREAAMKLLTTFIRLGVMKKPEDFPFYLVWFKDVKRYAEDYGLKEEVETV